MEGQKATNKISLKITQGTTWGFTKDSYLSHCFMQGIFLRSRCGEVVNTHKAPLGFSASCQHLTDSNWRPSNWKWTAKAAPFSLYFTPLPAFTVSPQRLLTPLSCTTGDGTEERLTIFFLANQIQ